MLFDTIQNISKINYLIENDLEPQFQINNM